MCFVLPWIQTFTDGLKHKFDTELLLRKGTPCASILAYKGFTRIGNGTDGLGILCQQVWFEAFLFQLKPADQRNGDGEAKCPACRARVCPTVLHPSEPGSWLPAQVIAPLQVYVVYISQLFLLRVRCRITKVYKRPDFLWQKSKKDILKLNYIRANAVKLNVMMLIYFYNTFCLVSQYRG